MRYDHHKARRPQRRAAIFVDFDNLTQALQTQANKKIQALPYLDAILTELRQYLRSADQTRTTLINAYADFGHYNGQVIQELSAQGVQPCFVSSVGQPNASEVQICLDAAEVLHTRPDIRVVVLVTGDRPYLPLVRQLKRQGCHPLVVTMDRSIGDGMASDEDVFLDAYNLLTDTLRRDFSRGDEERYASAGPPEVTEPVDDPLAVSTLEVIYEHFGQYEEIYLTPLLRRLSDEFGDDYDPKAIIQQLEEAGAVYLEKRRGTPHDYTVLILNERHPEVSAIRESFYDGSYDEEEARPMDPEDLSFEGDDYDDEPYDDLDATP
ncbi:MAG: NYN domain-containing protein [Bacteroidota bacterium]